MNKHILIIGAYEFLKHFPETMGEYTVTLSKEKEPWGEYYWFSKYYSHIVLFSFGKILTEEQITTCRPELLNLHPSPLPSYRGANPIQAQYVAGVTASVVTLQKVATKVDTGGILSTAPYSLSEHSVATITENAAKAGVEALQNYLEPKPVTVKHTSGSNFIGYEGKITVTTTLVRLVWFMEGKCWFINSYGEKVFIKTIVPELYPPLLDFYTNGIKDPNENKHIVVSAYKVAGKAWSTPNDYFNGCANKTVQGEVL